jgi:SAM-dependent methyltransferase
VRVGALRQVRLSVARRLLPRRAELPFRLRRLQRPARLGVLRRTRPLSDHWGFDRGTPVDRYYIERFLQASAGDIRGRVLEVLDDSYTRRYGRAVSRSDVVDIDGTNPVATLRADLAAPVEIADASFDCFILTQTLQLIYDVHAVVRHAYRVLAPDGVLLVTVPALSRVAADTGDDGDYWRFTSAGCRRLFGDVFGPGAVEVLPSGNVLAGVAFLSGMASEEIPRASLDDDDPRNPLVITIRAVKRAAAH